MSEFECNKHGQLVYIPTVERISNMLRKAHFVHCSIDDVAAVFARGVYRDAERMILPIVPDNFQFPHLRAQDMLTDNPARLKFDAANDAYTVEALYASHERTNKR